NIRRQNEKSILELEKVFELDARVERLFGARARIDDFLASIKLRRERPFAAITLAEGARQTQEYQGGLHVRSGRKSFDRPRNIARALRSNRYGAPRANYSKLANCHKRGFHPRKE